MPQITTRVTIAQDATTKNSPLTNEEIDQNFINLNNAITLSQDATGFVDRTSSTLAFVDATRTLTLSPTGANFTVYFRGKAFVISSSKTIVISDTSGGHYIVYDHAQDKLVDVGATTTIRDQILVSYIYWDAVDNNAVIFGDERHSVSRDTQWHYYQHTISGAIWKSGGDISYTINNTNQVQLAISGPIVLADEDLEHTIVHAQVPSNPYEQWLQITAYLPIIYLSGTGYKQTAATNVPWYPSTSRAYYNPISGGSGSLATVPSNDLYIVYWVIATNDTRYPIKLVMGRVAHAAYSEAESEDFDAYGLSMPEVAPMYKIVLKTNDTYTQNTARVNIVSVRELVGKQNARSNSFDTMSHSSLSDRFTVNQHSISSITDLQTTLDGISGNSIAMAIALG